MEEIKPLSAFKKTRKIPIKTKIETIEFAKTNNNALAAKKYGVTTKSIRRWKQNETIFKSIDNPNKKITLHAAPINRTINIELEKSLYDWIDYNRSLGNPITTWSIGIEIIKRDKTKRDIKPKSLLSFIYRFLARNNLSIRKGTHIGQQLPTNSLDLVYSFL